VALTSSVAATLGVSAGLAYADHAAATTTEAAETAATTASGTTGASTSTSTATGSSSTSTTTSSASSSSTTYADGLYTGASESTKWGPYQVQVTIEDGKITSVVETEAPTDQRSVTINDRAAPVLESEAVAAQSADIDAVSGATYTSRTYKASLQSALDLAMQAATASGANG
jgi:uncharacterized protein with FMN-binding domain